jgi:hypothetical protein
MAGLPAEWMQPSQAARATPWIARSRPSASAAVRLAAFDREIFSVYGHMSVEQQDEDGLHLLARYRNDTWGEMSTFWRFQVTGDKISRIDTGQA